MSHPVKLAFMHIPKSGGVSVEKALARGLEGVRVAPAYMPKDYEGQSYETLGAYDVFWGHFDFDFVRTLPPDYVCAVVVRDPLSQMLSLFNHIATREKHPRHADLVGSGARFADFVLNTPGMKNIMAKHLLGRKAYADIIASGATSRQKVEMACAQVLENLGRFTVVGTTSELAAFVEALSSVLATPISPPGRENANKRVVLGREHLTQEDIAAFERASWIDRSLYNLIWRKYLGQGER